jgi:enoyl-CoA hydratase
MTYEALRVERRESFAEVVLLGPGKGNAMGPAFWREVPRVFAELDRDDAVRAVVVRGDGKQFTFGLDLPAMMNELGPKIAPSPEGAMAKTRTELYELILELQEAFNAIERCKKPVIAAIHGWCIGGGIDMISACDVRVASRDAKFSVREVRVAMVADLGTLQRLPRIVGEGHARELALTGRDFDADRAQRIGLVNDLYDDPEACFEAARALARSIADNPPLVVQGVKRVLNERDGKTIAEGLRHVAVWNSAFLPSKDLGEAFAAFFERRSPKFRGE